ncbi:MAG: RuBisCO large subunit C-terminal-like domain-containing protein, partial [Candidatus Nanohaloarchaeota archaeon QJJ-9]|nr:RuBisCO large subunit C-terminal-like domain-containing protein [Candidatus Nanohaloarchaeota archaeon QJJ-9]
MASIKYSDFVDLDHQPKQNELVCKFYIEPAEGLNIEEAAGRVASESSNGTWAELEAESRIKDMSARAFDIQGREIKIAYPPILFEEGNMPQILSCIAGNIMGMKAVDRIRLKDVEWPESVVKGFRGPQFGSRVKEDIFDIEERPITATVPKPKVGMTSKQHAEVGYKAWTGGLDLLKDDENLTGQKFNQFKRRVKKSLENRDKAEKETGDKKSYLINITASADEMMDRAEFVKEQGGEYVMVDIVTA